MRALLALDAAWPRIPSTVGGCRTYVAGKLVTDSAALTRELGLFNFVLLLARLKVAPLSSCWPVCVAKTKANINRTRKPQWKLFPR